MPRKRFRTGGHHQDLCLRDALTAGCLWAFRVHVDPMFRKPDSEPYRVISERSRGAGPTEDTAEQEPAAQYCTVS